MDRLFLLIKSMTKAEKGYFKKQAKLHTKSGKSNYITLFNAIDRQKEYNEAKLLKKFSGERFTNNFPMAKSYLFQSILKSLIAYKGVKKADRQITEYMQFAALLNERKIEKEAKKLFTKAKALAYEVGEYGKILEIIGYEKSNITRNTSSRMLPALNKLLTEEKEILKIIENNNQYDFYYYQIFNHIKTLRTIRDEKQLAALKQLMDLPLFTDQQYALSFNALVRHYAANAFYNELINQYEKAYTFSKKLKDLWHSHPARLNQNPKPYIAALQNYLNRCGRVGKMDAYPEAINELEQIKADTRELQLLQFEKKAIWQLNYAVGTFQLENAHKISREIEQKLPLYDHEMNQVKLWILYYNLMLLHFYLADYPKALEWNNRLLNDKAIHLRQDMQCYARIINLVIHFELDNTLALEYFIKSTYRYLNNRKQVFEFEKIFLRFLKKLVNLQYDPMLLNKSFSELHQECLRLQQHPYEKKVFQEYFDFVSWLESKLNNTPFLTILRRKHEENNQINP